MHPHARSDTLTTTLTTSLLSRPRNLLVFICLLGHFAVVTARWMHSMSFNPINERRIYDALMLTYCLAPSPALSKREELGLSDDLRQAQRKLSNGSEMTVAGHSIPASPGMCAIARADRRAACRLRRMAQRRARSQRQNLDR